MNSSTSLLEALCLHQECMAPELFINVLVDYLAEDVYWLNNHISKYDREVLLLLANRLKPIEGE